jgi:hypothetical protein
MCQGSKGKCFSKIEREDDIIPQSSFLRQIPLAWPIQERIGLEAVAEAIDAIVWSFDHLREAANAYGTRETVKMRNAQNPIPEESISVEPTSNPEDYGMFVNCWSIVNQCHMLRQILNTFPLAAGSVPKKFWKSTNQFSDLRNQSNHLHQNLRNIAKKKGRLSPVFGSLSFTYVSSDMVQTNPDGSTATTGCIAFILVAGRLTHEEHLFAVPNPAGHGTIDVPVDYLKFEAAGIVVDFNQLIKQLDELVGFFDNAFGPSVLNTIRSQASAQGLDPEVVLSERSTRYLMALPLSFVPIDEKVGPIPDETLGRDEPGESTEKGPGVVTSGMLVRRS